MELELIEIVKPGTYPTEKLGYVGVAATYNSQWATIRHSGTDLWEFPGGNIDPGETPFEAAKRELYEETGTLRCNLTLVGQYSTKLDSLISYGSLFYAEILEIGDLPDFEIGEVAFLEDPTFNKTRYPKVVPQLFEFIRSQVKLLV